MDIEVSIEKTAKPKTRPPEEKLSFGRYFSDHMFVSDYTTARGWTSARIVPYQAMSIDPGASVLHYGQALFEGMKAFRGVDGKIRLFRPEMNWKRLQEGAARLCMKAPDLDLFMAGLQEFVRTEKEWIPESVGTALYLRPTLIGTEAFLGVRPSEAYCFYIIASPVGNYYGEGAETVKIWVERGFARCAPGGIGAVKAGGNYAASLLAATEAKKRGYAQVLWLDAATKTFVEEVGTMNVFFKIGDRVITPPLSGTILPGVMRDSAIQLLESMQVKTEIRPISLDEVFEAHKKGELKEVFGTGTAASISPVGSFGMESGIITINDGRVGELSKKLFETILDIQYGRRPDNMGWTMEVANTK